MWRYCRDSAEWIFGAGYMDQDVDRLYAAVLQAGSKGLSLTKQRDLFGRHRGRDLETMRKELEERGMIVTHRIRTAGRPVMVSIATEATKETEELTDSYGADDSDGDESESAF